MEMGAEQESQAELIAVLALADGAAFYGRPFGAVSALAGGRRGEVVFATPMTGYQEICTDPSYRGQMVVLTYPLVGNYGVAPEDVESRRPWLSALLVRECCDEYSGWRAAESLDAYLARNGIPGVCELDTRALTRHLRDHGTQRGILRAFPAGAAIDLAALVAEAQAVRSVSELDCVAEVSLPDAQPWTAQHALGFPPVATSRPRRARRATSAAPCATKGMRAARPLPARREGAGGAGPRGASPSRPRVVVIDTGYKEHIARCLDERGLQIILAPHDIDLPELLALRPDGILLANGPGDPESEAGLVALVRELLRRHTCPPLMGICLGHQIIGLAAGASTSRLPFGHHGANHPVLEVRTGRVSVTSQNHNFQVDAASLPAESGFEVSHVNLSDGSVEGLAHRTRPVFSVQFHPEARPGPEDNRDLFDRFARLIERERGARAQPEAVAV
jgi:carbamoyl-phosphate synthase small subunit